LLALGPWANDVLDPLGVRLPLAVKRGYHRHFRPQGNAMLGRPVLDAENGYCLAPMEQGIRLTTGVEFAARDAPPTPVQLACVLPAAWLRNIAKLPRTVESLRPQRTYVFLTNSWPAARADFALNDFACVRRLEEHAAVAALVALRRTLIFGVRLAHLLLRHRR
jgi:glycine/D-amino acid oxidase-like deaminating enzyme